MLLRLLLPLSPLLARVCVLAPPSPLTLLALPLL
jgi:hypothetical protein